VAFAEGDTLSSHPPLSASRLALIVSADEWCADTLQSVLEPGGYRVVRAAADAPTLGVVVGANPDVIVVAVSSPHGDVVELCRRLRREASIAVGTAVVMVAVAPTSLAERLASLRAGAWDVLALPMNAEELLARLDTYVGVKREADGVRAEDLLDHVSGLYAVRGVEYRARELLADASRHHLALACVVLGVDPELEQEPVGANDPAASTRVLQHVATVLHTHGRLSDIIGRWNHTAFAVLAPGTNAAGAAQLAHRLGQVVEASQPPPGVFMSPLEVRAGYEAVDDAGATRLRAQDLLARAGTALQRARVETSLPRIRRYSPDIGDQAPL
jgi:PleD family two-component response regulator